MTQKPNTPDTTSPSDVTATAKTEQARTTGTASAQVDATRETAKSEASRTYETAAQEADRLKSKAVGIGEKAKDAAARTADEARNYARNVAEDQKLAAADGVGDVARALEDAAEQLDGRYGFVSGYVRNAAGEVDRVASSLRDNSVDDLYHSVESFARRQPTAFLGATVLAGFALARFIKSSAPEQDVYYGEPRYGLPAERGYGQGIGQDLPSDADAPYAEAGIPHRAVNPPNAKPAGSPSTASNLSSGVSSTTTPAASLGTR